MDVRLSGTHHVHVRSAGDGKPTFLLVHGWAVSGHIWDTLVDHWPAGAGQLLMVDLRGAGWSSKPREGYTLDDYAGDLVNVVDHLTGELKLSDIVLVGHSMGGQLAMRVALERPQALSKLVLVSPVPPGGVPFGDADLAYFRSLGGHRAGAEQVLGMMMSRKPDAKSFERAVSGTSTVVLEAFLGGFDAWRTANFADRVGAITTPTVVFGGELEQPLSPALIKEHVVARIPGATFVQVPGVGHYPYIEAPEEFVKLLRESVA